MAGASVSSELQPGISYRLGRLIGKGAMGWAYLAHRKTDSGESPVVVKVINPGIAQQVGENAELAIRKEAIALGRLNERVPPTPFVVRFIDTGSLTFSVRGVPVRAPWIAVEYVHGGNDGATLHDRVRKCVRDTGYAFSPPRAERAIRCLGEGLEAIHEVGVLHRDLAPGNILCCGHGSQEILKIADFGVARPSGVDATFGDVALGTPGYSPPEQLFPGKYPAGTWSDVFGLAALSYLILTGEAYFSARSAATALLQATDEKRPRLADASRLHPDLRGRDHILPGIDELFASATRADPEQRPARAEVFTAALLGMLADAVRSSRGARRHSLEVIPPEPEEPAPERLFIVRHPPGDDRVLRSVAWDVDGRCLAVGQRGMEFWTGTSWVPAPGTLVRPGALRFASLVRPGLWLVGGDEATMMFCAARGGRELRTGPDVRISFTHGSGDPDDLAVFAGVGDPQGPSLHACAGNRWLEPLRLPDVSAIAGVARIADERWLVCGRGHDGAGWVGVYEPLRWRLERLQAPGTSAYTNVGANPDRHIGLAVGRSGVVLHTDSSGEHGEVLPGAPELSAAGLDMLGGLWVGAAGELRYRPPGESWRVSWSDSSWTVPFISLTADVGWVSATTADGAILEGRSTQPATLLEAGTTPSGAPPAGASAPR